MRSDMLQPKKKKKIPKYKQTNKKEQFEEKQISIVCIRSIRLSFFFSRPQNIIESIVFAKDGAWCLAYNAGTYRHGTCPCEKEQILNK